MTECWTTESIAAAGVVSTAPVEAYWRPYGMHMVVVGDSIACNMVRVAGSGRLATVAASEYSNLNFGLVAQPGAHAEWGVDKLYGIQSYGCYCPPNICIGFGTNDCHPDSGVSVAEYRAQLERACQQAGTGKRYLFVDICRVDEFGENYPAYNAALIAAKNARKAMGYDVKWGAWSEMCAANPSWLDIDGVHPDAAGLWARNRMICAWARNVYHPNVHP